MRHTPLLAGAEGAHVDVEAPLPGREPVYDLFHRPDRLDVERDIALLARHEPHWVSLSPHDSSDEITARFRQVFASRYYELRVGEWMKVAASPQGQSAAAGL